MQHSILLCSALGTALAASLSPGHEDGALQFAAVPDNWSSNGIRSQGLSTQGLFTPKGLLLTKRKPWTERDEKHYLIDLYEQLIGKDTKQRFKEPDDHGSSIRLGNMIDLWWYTLRFPGEGPAASRGGIETKDWPSFVSPYHTWINETSNVFFGQCRATKKCFGRYLAEEAEKIRKGSQTQLPHTDSASERLKIARAFMDQDYGVYAPHWVKDLMMPEVQNDLMKALRTYATKNDPRMLDVPEADAVVHYRVGDILSNEPPIHPRSIAEALASLSPQPKTIEVLNGGFKFAENRNFNTQLSFAVSSMKLLRSLSDEILKALPNSTITMPTTKTAKHFTVDQDWAKLVNAKSIVRSRCTSFCMRCCVALVPCPRLPSLIGSCMPTFSSMIFCCPPPK